MTSFSGSIQVRNIEEIGVSTVVEWLRKDAASNLFALYDLLHDLAHTKMLLALDGGEIMGYLLEYRALRYPVAILQGPRSCTEVLIDALSEQRLVLFGNADVLEVSEKRLSVTAAFAEDLMIVERSQARLPDNPSRQLTAKDIPKLAELYAAERSNLEANEGPPLTQLSLTGERTVHGLFVEETLASVAGTHIESEDGWVIGGVYTRPEFRNRGYATMVTAAITQAALASSEMVALYVVSGNAPATRAYEKLGYRTIGQRFWIEIETESTLATAE